MACTISNIECTANTLKAISHPLRLKILCNLNKDELTVHEILQQTGTTQSNISQHLNHLKDKGILESRREANRVYYRIGDKQLLQIMQMMNEVYCSNKKQ